MQNTNIENIYNGVTDSEKSLSSSDEKPLKKAVGKPRTAMWRWGRERMVSIIKTPYQQHIIRTTIMKNSRLRLFVNFVVRP